MLHQRKASHQVVLHALSKKSLSALDYHKPSQYDNFDHSKQPRTSLEHVLKKAAGPRASLDGDHDSADAAHWSSARQVRHLGTTQQKQDRHINDTVLNQIKKKHSVDKATSPVYAVQTMMHEHLHLEQHVDGLGQASTITVSDNVDKKSWNSLNAFKRTEILQDIVKR